MIRKTRVIDARFPLQPGEGSDAIHQNAVYSYAVTELEDDSGKKGVGLAFTIGQGNELVCQAAKYYAEKLKGNAIEEIMAEFGKWSRSMADDQQLRWVGPHKGVVQLALSSVTNACFDLWAKKKDVPLWKLLIDLSSEELINTLDLSYYEDELTSDQALAMLREQQDQKDSRASILEKGYPGYDTSVGWFHYEDDVIRKNCKAAIDAGFTAMKLKVGSPEIDRDVRRAGIVREVAGDKATIMLDVNQQWNLPKAMEACRKLAAINPYWIEEPTHPDDILAHKKLADAIHPIKLALGEHVPNRIVFKNYLQTGCAGFIQVDAVRVAGVSEFITVSMLSKKFGVPVVPHVGDMGQLHQHLVLFNHIALGHEALLLEHIPHLRHHFVHPVNIENARYKTPQETGSSCDLNIQSKFQKGVY